jgi:hypothetical protein
MVYRNCINLLQELSQIETTIKKLEEYISASDVSVEDEELLRYILNTVISKSDRV